MEQKKAQGRATLAHTKQVIYVSVNFVLREAAAQSVADIVLL